MRAGPRWASDLDKGGGPPAELNLTPMIDVVFQLIIFFLISMRFTTLDQRIESMLPKDGW